MRRAKTTRQEKGLLGAASRLPAIGVEQCRHRVRELVTLLRRPCHSLEKPEDPPLSAYLSNTHCGLPALLPSLVLSGNWRFSRAHFQHHFTASTQLSSLSRTIWTSRALRSLGPATSARFVRSGCMLSASGSALPLPCSPTGQLPPRFPYLPAPREHRAWNSGGQPVPPCQQSGLLSLPRPFCENLHAVDDRRQANPLTQPLQYDLGVAYTSRRTSQAKVVRM